MANINTSSFRNSIDSDSNNAHKSSAKSVWGDKYNFAIHKYPLDLETSAELSHYVAFFISVPKGRIKNYEQTPADEAQSQIRNYLGDQSANEKLTDAIAGFAQTGKKGAVVGKLQEEHDRAIASGDSKKAKKLEAAIIDARESYRDVDEKDGLIDQIGAAAGMAATNQYISAQEMVCLYIPETLSTAYNMDWQTDSFRKTSAMAQAASSAIQAYKSGDGFWDTAGNIAGSVAESGMKMGLAAVLSSDIMSAGTKMVINPYMEMLFRGVQNRKFELQFKFTPRDPKEARQAWDVIQTFKKYAHPSVPNEDLLKQFFIYPAEWDIIFYTVDKGEARQNRFLARYGRSILSSISIDYGASGATSFLRPDAELKLDGAPPVETDITLSFEEIDLITADKFDSLKENNKSGF